MFDILGEVFGFIFKLIINFIVGVILVVTIIPVTLLLINVMLWPIIFIINIFKEEKFNYLGIPKWYFRVLEGQDFITAWTWF